jgi:hypothetical protein
MRPRFLTRVEIWTYEAAPGHLGNADCLQGMYPNDIRPERRRPIRRPQIPEPERERILRSFLGAATRTRAARVYCQTRSLSSRRRAPRQFGSGHPRDRSRRRTNGRRRSETTGWGPRSSKRITGGSPVLRLPPVCDPDGRHRDHPLCQKHVGRRFQGQGRARGKSSRPTNRPRTSQPPLRRSAPGSGQGGRAATPRALPVRRALRATETHGHGNSPAGCEGCWR